MQSRDEQSIMCGDITVFYTQDTDGGGSLFSNDYVITIKELYPDRIFDRCYEWCSGPGFIGYSILGNHLCDTLCLSDIYQPALDQASRTALINDIEKNITIYNSDNWENIPSHEKFDLIVSNPPHFNGSVYILDRMDANPRKYMDRDWKIHKKFYQGVKNHLSIDGVILLQEFAWGSGLETFKSMIDDAGLKIQKHFLSNYRHPNAGYLLYYLEIVHKDV